ncbi:MAG: hypothetical protein ACK5HL_03720 [Bacilli bacterium]
MNYNQERIYQLNTNEQFWYSVKKDIEPAVKYGINEAIYKSSLTTSMNYACAFSYLIGRGYGEKEAINMLENFSKRRPL